MAETVYLPLLDPTNDLSPRVIAALADGATAARDPVDFDRIIITFSTLAKANAFKASISLPSSKLFWGVSAKASLTAVEIPALGNSEAATGYLKSVVYNCSGGRYPYIAYPAGWGTPSAVTVGGLSFSDLVVSDVLDVDGDGTYRTVRFGYLQNGNTIQVEWK
ncbi:hypothetical protein WSK_3128 [Novosphingobium sp. Rr 2-17]|uniref:hypothetical protein n=1 Tax=Novosphingobium sp. Rr 2-17 TaxID=555793 RepID=UPI0002698225|nr:hypothetical protein [Novosphingobium sp. Rr 2-17]EIZ78246.1 hypothetical protein WSK_3128 [Novosphingobium sp. Rr 2-17]